MATGARIGAATTACVEVVMTVPASVVGGLFSDAFAGDPNGWSTASPGLNSLPYSEKVVVIGLVIGLGYRALPGETELMVDALIDTLVTQMPVSRGELSLSCCALLRCWLTTICDSEGAAQAFNPSDLSLIHI